MEKEQVDEATIIREYEFDFGCYRGGLFRDGGLKKITAVDDRDAIGQSYEHMGWLRRMGHYDRIDYRLKEGQRLVTGNC